MFDFPASPTQGQQFSPSAGVSYVYNGYAWDLLSGPVAGLAANSVRVFTSSQTYTPTPGIAFAMVECVGGGGGGGAAYVASGFRIAGGGGAGGYSRRLLTAAQIGASQTITIGAAGVGGTGGTSPIAGTAGGDTSFGALCLAKGGGGGDLSSTTPFGGAGGSGALGIGDVTSSGAPGCGGHTGTGSEVPYVGFGGSSVFGGGAATPTAIGAPTNGLNATNYGSGGSAGSGYAGSGRNGGNGSAGVCIVTEYGGSTAAPVTVPKITTITSSGIYTPSPGLVAAIVEVVGGGGGGGAQAAGASPGGAPGGGSGGYSKRLLTAAQLGASQTITIGTGGAGGATVGGDGVDGGATSFGSLVIANGGKKGTGSAVSYTAGAGADVTGAVGDVVAAGAPGGTGSIASPYGMAGLGGSSALGGGGVPKWVSGTNFAHGTAASNYGGGGAGGYTGASAGGNANGGAGSPGVCIVTEFIQQGGAAAAALPGSRVLIQTQTVSSAVAQVDFTTGIDSTYDEYEIHIIGLKVSVDDVLGLRISTDGGGTWKSGATDYYYATSLAYSNTAGAFAGAASTYWPLSGATITATGVHGMGGFIVRFFQPSNTTDKKTFLNDGGFGGANGATRVSNSMTYFTDTNAINSIRFFLAGGNTIAKGTFNLYGIKK